MALRNGRFGRRDYRTRRGDGRDACGPDGAIRATVHERLRVRRSCNSHEIRTGSYDDAWTLGQGILGRGSYPDRIELETITPELFEATLETFERYVDHSLTFTDANTIALVDDYDLDAVLSFDDDFDGLVDRIDPETIANE